MVYAAVLVVGTAFSLFLARVAWRTRPKPAALPIAVLMLAAATWMVAIVTTTFVRAEGVSRLLLHVQYVAIPAVISAWLWAAVEFSGRASLLTRRVRVALAAFPVVVGVASTTSRFHGALWASVDAPTAALPYAVEATQAPGYWVYVAVAYGLFAVGTILVVRTLARSEALRRAQAAALTVVVLVPWAGNVAFFTADLPLDVTPIGFVVGGLAIGYAQYRLQFVTVSGVGHGSLVESIREGVFVLDESNRFVDVNPKACELLGVDPEERVVGRRARDVLAATPAVYERYADVVETDEVLTVETPRGTRSYDVRASPLLNDAGRPVGRLFLVHDVTDRKRRERDLRRQNESLEEFATLVSDDLRELLVAAEDALATARANEDPEALASVSAEHERLRVLVENVLRLSRDAKTVEDVDWVSLAALARATFADVDVDTTGVDLVVDVDVRVRADRERLGFALAECFENAVVHGDGETSTIRVAVSTDAHGSGFVVADDGPGFQPAARQSAFDAGFSTDPERTGFGLPIVRNVAHAHGWSVDASTSAADGVAVAFEGVATAAGERTTASDDESTTATDNESTTGERDAVDSSVGSS